MGPGAVDLTSLDVSAVVDRAAERAQDTLYVAVGFGVLSFQKAQVRRREVNAGLRKRLSDDQRSQLQGLVRLSEELDDGLDHLVERLADRLPQPTSTLFAGLHHLGRLGRDLARSQLRELSAD